MTTTITSIRDGAVAGPVAAGVRPPVGTGPPWPWDWGGMSPEAAEAMWDTLEKFVAFLEARYAWSAEQLLPACWAEHGALVEELTTLYWSRLNAFEGPKPMVELAQTWHHQTLPGFYQRLRGWLGDRGGECRAGQHPAVSPAAEIDQAVTVARYAERRQGLVTADLQAREARADANRNGAG